MRILSLIAMFSFAVAAHGANYVIVAKNIGKDTTGIESAVKSAGGTVTASLPQVGIVLAVSNAQGFANALVANSDVQNVAEDVVVSWIGNVPATQAADADVPANREPFNARLWNIRQIHANDTAAAGYRGNNVVRARVAVLDEGVICNHEDIAPNLNVSLGRSFIPGEAACVALVNTFNHGTHVAGIIAAAINGKGVQGVAPEAELVAVKVLSEKTGSGSFGSIIQGILYAAGPAVHADVINMSLGATFDRNNASGDGLGLLVAALNRAVDYATAQGTLVVSAAGNEAVDLNSRLWSIPAQSGNGMAVSATGPVGQQNLDRLASYSNYGQSVVDVAAPGGDFVLYPSLSPIPWTWDMVLSAGGIDKKGKSLYYYAAGTSMAAPHVSGIAALIVGKYGRMMPAQLKSMIEQSAVDILTPGADAGTGKGRVDALKALQ